jgi:hypothetical protein
MLNQHLPFVKNKLSSAILISVLVGAMSSTAQAVSEVTCTQLENTITDDQSEFSCRLENNNSLT